MPKRTDISSILVIGSGPIVIGQACEFDYSGTQAVKALKEEGYRVILVNSNPATIMTDPEFADRTYIEPITAEFVAKVIERERPDVLLPTIGGQTALNVAIELSEQGILDKFNVELIGANVEAIKAAEDRDKFKRIATACGLESARSFLVTDEAGAIEAAKTLGFPLVIRPSRTLGGSGGGFVHTEAELLPKIRWGFECSPNHELLLEESLLGWKEVELEVMRDKADNGVIICAIENVDPMGLHTGDSITVAPLQTLTDKEYQQMRDAALRLMRAIGVDTGGSNVQFSVDPKSGRQIIIEMNPRVSRSSALASKATGFPIAKIAAKLAIGYTLDELPNDITKMTPACFEPSIDYVVVKIPRFTFEKFEGADRTLGTQMKSVGEAMAIGRTFAESLQKACRSLEQGRSGILGGPESKETDLKVISEKMKPLTPERIFLAARAIELGMPIEKVAEITAYDIWYLYEIKRIVDAEARFAGKQLSRTSAAEILEMKRIGMSDIRAAQLLNVKEEEFAAHRRSLGVRPAYLKVDTCAAEFASETPYFYSSYETTSDTKVTDRKKIVILGGGPNRIGQGLEFDYCCVHAAFAFREAGYEAIMVNCNPETVSTDYDTSDRLYFEPLTFEDVLEIVHWENPHGVIVQYGGQTPLRLAQVLKHAGVPIIGTNPDAIDMTEDREKFRAVLNDLGLKQAASGIARNEKEALAVAKEIGFPLLIRPSFVLGGRAMAIIHDDAELKHYISKSVEVSFNRPVLLDRFLDNAIEVDVDAVNDATDDVVICGIIEHIERAGVHSGDSSFLLPAQTLSDEIIARIEDATRLLARRCDVCGLMNVQYAVHENELYVLEVNPRASRSVPFVSKVMGVPWAKVAARVMAGETLKTLHEKKIYGDILRFREYAKAAEKIPYVAVKESVFPWAKFRGVDTVLGPEMRSTGEVMGIDRSASGGLHRAQKAVGMGLPTKGTVFISVTDSDKAEAVDITQKLERLGFDILATKGTAAFLAERGIRARSINKVRDGSPHVVDELVQGKIHMVINTPEGTGPLLDSRTIRSTSTELSLPLFTTMAAADAAVSAIEQTANGLAFEVCSMQEYLAEIK